MEALFKKYFWAIKALGIAAATGLAASAVTTQLGTRFLLDVGEGGDEQDVDEETDEEDEEDDVEGRKFGDNPFRKESKSDESLAAKIRVSEDIRKRNIFCPTCLPVEAPETITPELDGEAVAGIQPGEIKSSLPLRLMATMEAEDPTFSFATVHDSESEVSGLYGQGDLIRPGVLVVGVDMGIVHLRNGASLEYIELGSDVEKKRSRSRDKDKDKSKDTKKKKKRSKNEIPGAEDAINCPNENLCVVERKFVEQLMANPAMLAKQARIVPSQKDGETRGFKFYGIRRGSLPKLLGLKNGDMLTEVNGEQLDGMDKAMALYTKLRRASNLTVTIERKGKTISKEIQIQ